MREFSSTHRRLGKKVLELHAISRSYAAAAGPAGDPAVHLQLQARRAHRHHRAQWLGQDDLSPARVRRGSRPDTGTVVKGETTVFAYFDQTTSLANGKLTVLDFIKELAERVHLPDGASLSAEQFLERFLFPRPMQSQPIERLSGGELRRLDLVRLLATAPNFLLLDEPTNDLDLDTIRLLEEYLVDFPGCILLVSHDRALLDRLTDYLFVFDGDGGIRGFTGNYEDYREALAEEARAARPPERAPARRETRREKKSDLSFKERQEYELLEKEIVELEEEQKRLESLFQQPVQDPSAIEKGHRRYREIEALLATRMARWELLAPRAEG